MFVLEQYGRSEDSPRLGGAGGRSRTFEYITLVVDPNKNYCKIVFPILFYILSSDILRAFCAAIICVYVDFSFLFIYIAVSVGNPVALETFTTDSPLFGLSLFLPRSFSLSRRWTHYQRSGYVHQRSERGGEGGGESGEPQHKQ